MEPKPEYQIDDVDPDELAKELYRTTLAVTASAGKARAFNIGGRSGMAIKCGSYKRIDKYARQSGFPKHNNSTAVTIVFDDETESMTGFANLEMCARFMQKLYG